jgi:hypothetical protein
MSHSLAPGRRRPTTIPEVRHAPGRPRNIRAVPVLRDRMRQLRNRWIDQTLVQVERARASFASGVGDILVLGDSSFLSWAYRDTDRTLLPDLIAERTGATVVTIAAGGYDARMHDAILRVLSMVEYRPRAVVMAVALRPNTGVHVREHPLHGHARSRAALARVTPPLRHVRSFANGGSSASKREVRAFRALPLTTRWGGTVTIQERLAQVEGLGPPPWPIEVERRRFDYFHGEFVDEDNPGLKALTALGRRLTEYGVRTVANWSQVPVAYGETLFPGEFASHVHRHLDLVESALLREAVGVDGLLRPSLEDEDFQDVRNGTEHFSYSGRVKIADEIAKTLSTIGV